MLLNRTTLALTTAFGFAATPAPAQQPGVDERPANPPSSTPQPSVGESSGPLVMLAARYASYAGRAGHFAVPVACVDSTGAFVQPPEQCVADLSVGTPLVGVDALDQAVTAGALEDVPDRFERGFLLTGEPTARLFSLGAVPSRLECDLRMSELDLPAMAAVSGIDGPINLTQSSCWDLNSDGQLEIWLSTGQDSERAYEFVEVRSGQLIRVGGTIWLGD